MKCMRTWRKNKMTNIVFMGTPAFSAPILRMLHEEGYNVLAVVTQPDRPVGRKKVFGDVESFITFLHDNKKILNEYANELLNNQYFLAWLTQLGYEKHINEWRSILTN